MWLNTTRSLEDKSHALSEPK